MRKFLPLTSIVLLFSSCTAYQYMTVSSNDMKQNEQREFVVENDSIRLRYRFDGQNAPVQLEVQNKLSKPMYVDWKRSALIVNDNAISYKPGSLSVSGSTYTSVSNWMNSGRAYNNTSASSTSSFKSTVEFPGDMEFIPPASKISQSPMGLTNKFHFGKLESEFKRTKVPLVTGITNVSMASFGEENSPLRFSSYLTIYVDGEFEKPLTLQHSFYISEIIKTGLGPHNFQFISNREGNRFYVSSSTGFAKGMGYGVIAGAVILGAAAGASASGSAQ